MECPDYSDVDEETVFTDFHAMYGDASNANSDWLQKLKQDVAGKSSGKVALDSADLNLFTWRIKGPAEYLLLSQGDKKIQVVVGPYSSPIICSDKK
jgi:hypothetical protein